MKKKFSAPQNRPASGTSKGPDKASVARALMLLYNPEGEPFTKTQALDLWHARLGMAPDEARTLFAFCLQKEKIVKQSRRYCVPAPADGWHIGTVSTGRNGEALFTPAGDGSRTILSADDPMFLENLLPGDTVWASRLMDSWRLMCMASRCTTRLVCRVGTIKRRTAVNLANPLAGPTVTYRSNGQSLSRDSIVVVQLDDDLWEPLEMPLPLQGVVTEVLGADGDPDIEIDIAVNRFGIPHRFSEAVMQEADALPESVPESEAQDRVDLRDIAFVTIDGEDARDFDDAVWCTPHGEGWRLLVAIADVSHYVRPGSPLDAEAQRRSTSVYFPRRVVPMLPEKLSNGLCSLNPDVDRCTMVCDMVIAADGNVSAYQFYPALIHSKARLTYTCVWQALQGDSAELIERGGVLSDVSNLHALFKALREARNRRGAIDFESTETQIVFDPDTQQIAAITRREHNDAHRLIEECMLAANVCAADFIERNKHSCLYRVHDSPPPERLQKLREFLAGLHLTLGGGDKPTAADYGAVVEAVKPCPYSDTVQTALLRSMQQAVYSPVNIGHYGLNYERYTHFTSPIRRYPDLLVHRTIRAILAKTKYVPQIVVDATEFMQSRSARTLLEATDKSSTVWAQLGTITSAAERRADEASRDLVSWLKCTYMQRFVGRKFTGEVTGCVGAGAYVTLKSLFVDGFLHVSKFGNDYFEYYENEQRFVGRTTGRQIGPGTSLKVTVEEVDPQTRNIAFSTRGGPRYERFPDFNRKDFERDNPRRERVKTSRGSKHRKK